MSNSSSPSDSSSPQNIEASLLQAEGAREPGFKAPTDSNQPPKRAPGLLSHWLRRREPQPQFNTGKESLTAKSENATVAEAPGTPTWSESSETSDFASVEAQSSPAVVAASSVAPYTDPQPTGQQPQARLAGRLGGWLNGVTSAAGVVLGGAVRGGTKALQRLTAQERLQDLNAASQHLEATAAGLQGEARLRTLQRWCTILRELHPSNLPLLHCYTLHALSPGSPQHSSSCDSDWQQLQFAGPDAAPSRPASGGSNQAGVLHSKSQHGSPINSGLSGGTAARGPELEFWANQVLYLDQESSDTEKDLMTFRELLLHSYALENVIVGYLDVPASLPEERNVLVDLFGLCLAGDSALHTRLVDALFDLSAVEAECRGVGTAASLGPDQPPLANVVATAICGIKIQAECEVVDRKMATLKADIGEQAAEVHRSHKFNSGATEPTGDSSPTKLASGLIGTAEVMQLGSKFQEYNVQKASQVACRLQPQYESYLGIAQAHAKVLDTAVAELEAKADTTHKQKADGEAFRERKLAEMEGAMQVVHQEIGGLEEQQAELLRQLKLVQDQIAAAKAKRADMEEGRHVFQEGNAFTLEALQHQVDELSTQHRHHLAENAALAECQTLIQEAAKGWTATAGAAEAASEAALAQAGQEYMHAATRHLYYQRALLQLLLRQLTFCVNELQGLVEKEGSLERMGMEGIICDMRAGKQRLQAKYLEAHASAMLHFSDVAAVRTAVQAACSLPHQASAHTAPKSADHISPAAAQSLQQQSQGASNNSLTASSSAGLHPLADIYSPEQKSGQSPDRPLTSSQCTELSEELLDLFDSIERLRQEVVALQQPAGLPQTLSQQQEQTTEQLKETLGSGDSTLSEPSQPAPLSSQQQQEQTNLEQHSVQAGCDPMNARLDMQLSELNVSAGQSSIIASSSAADMLACNERLSSMYQMPAGTDNATHGPQAESDMQDTPLVAMSTNIQLPVHPD